MGDMATLSSSDPSSTNASAMESSEPPITTSNNNNSPTTTTSTTNCNSLYLYQNSATGSPSTHPLSVVQLCRILSATATSRGSIRADTLLLGFDPRSTRYAPEGWVAARHTPLLREACATWHYEDAGTVRGPVSTKELAHLCGDDDDGSSRISGGDDGGGSRTNTTRRRITKDTRVWSGDIVYPEHDPSNTTAGWKQLIELPHLMDVIEMIREKRTVPIKPLPNSNQPTDKEHFNTADKNEESSASIMDKEAEMELQKFLSSTGTDQQLAGDDDEHEEGYESDGGTQYVRDPRTGGWLHSALAPPKKVIPAPAPILGVLPDSNDNSKQKKRKRKGGAKFAAKHAKCWVYVTGLPTDTDEDEVARYFAKAGILELDPETQRPKVKLYRNHPPKQNKESESTTNHPPTPPSLKGDASLCYARSESVDLACTILDGSFFRCNDNNNDNTVHVQRAKFEQHGDKFDDKVRQRKLHSLGAAKRKVVRLAALQAVGWDEGENGRLSGGRKGLRIVVLQGMFRTPVDDATLAALEHDVRTECSTRYGDVEKITIFATNPAGVVVVKFARPTAAGAAVRAYDGRVLPEGDDGKVRATYWDGVTDYTTRDEEGEQQEEEARHQDFGNWLDNQELPEEFKPRVEG